VQPRFAIYQNWQAQDFPPANNAGVDSRAHTTTQQAPPQKPPHIRNTLRSGTDRSDADLANDQDHDTNVISIFGIVSPLESSNAQDIAPNTKEEKNQKAEELMQGALEDHAAGAVIFGRSLVHFIAAGIKLNAAKDLVSRGQWTALVAKYELSMRTAQLYMRLATYKDALNGVTTITEAVKILSMASRRNNPLLNVNDTKEEEEEEEDEAEELTEPNDEGTQEATDTENEDTETGAEETAPEEAGTEQTAPEETGVKEAVSEDQEQQTNGLDHEQAEESDTSDTEPNGAN
jgi:hypothetical protein